MSDDPPPIYAGVFLRLYVPQIPNWSPVGGLWEQCPDIVSGVGAILDPTTLVTNYDTPTAQADTLALGQPNFVYVCAVNSAQQAVTGRMWLFWAPSSTVLWPSTWLSTGVSVAGQMVNYQSMTFEAAPAWPDHKQQPQTSPVVATALPFVLTPPFSSTDTYSLVAIAENTPSTPPTPPLPQPFGNVAALAAWVETSGYVGWLAVGAEAPPSMPLTVTQLVTGSGALNIGASGTNLPADATLSIQCQGPSFATSVSVSQPVGSNPNPNVTTPVTWPSSFTTSLSATVIPGSTQIPSNASLRLLVYPSSDSSS